MKTAPTTVSRFVLSSLVACFVLLEVTGAAPAAQNLPMETADHWYVSCYGERCSMSSILSGVDGFEITLGLHFHRSTGKLTALAAMAPADADRDRGVEIGFRDASDSRKSIVVVTVPLAPCDATSCMGSTEADPATAAHDLQADFIDNMHKYPMLTASYHAKGQRKTVMEDSSRFKADYQTLLAELKKPQ